MQYGVDVHLVAPRTWHENGRSYVIEEDAVSSHGLQVRRAGDVNRHVYADPAEIRRVISDVQPDVIDIHEEPFSHAAWQWLRAIGRRDLPAVMYTAQNIDKRFPPPFAQFERHSFGRTSALYPCSRQAASVARGKGFQRAIRVIPLGFDELTFSPGTQSASDDEVLLGLFGRLVPEKGVLDAVRILEKVNKARPARLVVVGQGPEASAISQLARSLGVAGRVDVVPWQSPERLAETLGQTHVALLPSNPTPRWAEQFGRVIVEAQASGAVVAAYASGSIPEVIGNAGILAAPGEHSSLADLIVQLLRNDQDFQAMRRQGLAHSRSFTWDAVATAQADLYRTVIGGEIETVRLPASPLARRDVAHAEFGPSASTPVGSRPFALAALQRLRFADELATGIDWAAEVAVAMRQRAAFSQRGD